MAQVTVRINGYSYVVGCEDGQEAHLQAMAEQVENRIGSIKALGGQSGEARLLVLAALLLADELHDVRRELQHASVASRNGHAPSARAQKKEKDLARSLGRLANRAEEIAAGMEHP
jgi:cell division protein ZapA